MRRSYGFTLIELMITVAIVAILAAIVYPSYREQVLKSHRAEGKSALMQIAQNLERCYTATNTYAGCAPAPNRTFPFDTEHGRYRITRENPEGANTYLLTATRQAGQTADTRCGNLTLNEAGTKTVSGTSTVQNCW